MNEVKTWPSPDFAVTQNIGHDWIEERGHNVNCGVIDCEICGLPKRVDLHLSESRSSHDFSACPCTCGYLEAMGEAK